jgi:bacterioferritin (cytochrome b1)
MTNINDFKDKVDEDELARMTRELENNILGVKGEPSEHFGNKIQALRDRRESVENNLEAEAYTAEALRTVIDAQNASRQVDDTPSDVEGITQSELEALQKEARNTFAPSVKRQAR